MVLTIVSPTILRYVSYSWLKFLGIQYNIYSIIYYTAVSHKDWELPNLRICLAEIDIDRGLDFPI